MFFSDVINQQTSSSDTVSISIKPERGIYCSKQHCGVIDDSLVDSAASSENITFLITIKNNSAQPITIVHPFWTTAGNMNRGARYALDKRRGNLHDKSELVLDIVKPDGESIAIREYPAIRSFELNNYENDHYKSETVLNLGANDEVVFRLGCFFQTSMARWENKARVWEIFSKKGAYKVKVIFRNIHSTARVYYPFGAYEISNVWTGELISNEAVVEVR